MSRFQLTDWSQSHEKLTTTSRLDRSRSETARQAAVQTARDTTARLNAAARATDNEIGRRLDELEQSRRDYQQSHSDTCDEIDHLAERREVLATCLADTDEPAAINASCITKREARQGIDLVDDDVERLLNEEHTLLKDIREQLAEYIGHADAQLRRLRATKYTLNAELEAKTEALTVDSTSRDLGKTITPSKSSSSLDLSLGDQEPTTWREHTDKHLLTALTEREESVVLRGDIDKLIKVTTDDLNRMATKVERAFNERLDEYRDAKDEIEHDLAETQLEIQQAVRAIHQLRQEYDSTLGPLEIAEARIAERQKRPNMEFVHDDASRRLAIEVEEIKAGQVELRKELKKAQEEERALRRTALALKEDVDCKINSINIDNACMQERQQYKYRRIESTLTAKTQGLKL